MPNSAEYIKYRYEAYAREREALRSASLQLGGRYDQWLLTLAGGALALSLVFLEKVAPEPTTWTLVFLIPGWGALVLSIATGLLAINSGHHSYDIQIVILDQSFQEFSKRASQIDYTTKEYEDEPEEPINPHRKKLKLYNKISLSSFITGILLLCFFSIFNLPTT